MMRKILDRLVCALLLLMLVAALAALPARAQFADQQTYSATASGGTANAQTLTIPNVRSLNDLKGVVIRFPVGTTNTGATTLAVNSLTATAVRKITAAGLAAFGGGEWVSGQTACAMYDGTVFVSTCGFSYKLPTRQTFASGSGTYTTPAGAVRIYVRECGGGGGGGGTGTGAATSGGNGGNTTFSSTVANGGLAGTRSVGAQGQGGAGGTGGSDGSGTTGLVRVAGSGGNQGTYQQGAAGAVGGGGGTSPWGGAGSAGEPTAFSATQTAGTSSCSGGGGGGGVNTIAMGAGGGGSGEWVEFWIMNPAASYSYAVGAAGTAGAGAGGSGVNGGAGGSGKIVVDEYYQ